MTCQDEKAEDLYSVSKNCPVFNLTVQKNPHYYNDIYKILLLHYFQDFTIAKPDKISAICIPV